MHNDLIFRKGETTFQFRIDENANIKWRSWVDGDNPNEAFVWRIFILGEKDPREIERIIRSGIDSSRFSERDKKKVVKWYLSAQNSW